VTPADVPDGPLLVDTDVVSYWLTQAEQGNSFRTLVSGHEQAVSFATFGELLANAHRSKWGARRLSELHQRLQAFVVLPYNGAVVDIWAEMHARLSGHLHNGGANDLWTAACALASAPQLPIMTNNLKDFRHIASAFPAIRLIHPDL
jgi:predicted nucleic acid-binding protein